MAEFTVEELQARLGTRFVGRQAELYETIDSTNTRAVQAAQEGAPDGTLILAEWQSQGRGRLGRRWLAPTGSSLLLSLIFRPPLKPSQAQRMTMVCSLGAVAAIARVAGLQVQVKWPNDLLLEGKKLGGVLTELGMGEQRALAYVVVGMGINVNLDPTILGDVLTPATSLQAVLGRPVSRLDLLAALLEEIEARYEKLRAGWSPREEWRAHLATLGQHVEVKAGEELIQGTAEDIDEDGALLVRTPEGELRRILAGDVTLRGRRS